VKVPRAMLIDIIHTTRYSYSQEVAESAMEARLGPRTDSDQRVVSFYLSIEPSVELHSYTDGFWQPGVSLYRVATASQPYVDCSYAGGDAPEQSISHPRTSSSARRGGELAVPPIWRRGAAS